MELCIDYEVYWPYLELSDHWGRSRNADTGSAYGYYYHYPTTGVEAGMLTLGRHTESIIIIIRPLGSKPEC
jgi:hypothetical protein